jgi:hypothetical protein
VQRVVEDVIHRRGGGVEPLAVDGGEGGRPEQVERLDLGVLDEGRLGRRGTEKEK